MICSADTNADTTMHVDGERNHQKTNEQVKMLRSFFKKKTQTVDDCGALSSVNFSKTLGETDRWAGVS